LIDSLPDDNGDEGIGTPRHGQAQAVCEHDPAWMIGRFSLAQPRPVLGLVAERPWWPQRAASDPVAELIERLWRHSVALGIIARRLAGEAADPDPDAVGRAAQLCGLGYWALAAVDPDWLLAWWRLDDPTRRRQKERADLGADLVDLARRLAELWDCDPLLVDAAWLHADHEGRMNAAAAHPDRLSLVQRAFRFAEQTPWSLCPAVRAVAPPTEPRLKILIAEVQARCVNPFVDPDATIREQRATQRNARLLLKLAGLRDTQERSTRFLKLLADSSLAESLEEWAARAARCLCADPDCSAARVTWLDPAEPGPAGGDEGTPLPSKADSLQQGPGARPPSVELALGPSAGPRASIQLWSLPESPSAGLAGAFSALHRAWEAWATLVADRERLERKTQVVAASFREHVRTEHERLRQGRLDALAEFAAGAGHELNNPLAVIVGRAQLLLSRSQDPDVARSLRIILNQAQRTHRILRDMMFVARPPAQRCRPCRPTELLGSLLADFERDCAARGVRLVSELDQRALSTWADAEALSHLGEILLRNALDATPAGGRILVRSTDNPHEFVWSIFDTGKGLSASEAAHLFDPFYCGRQAGRGLGLGLPRAARIVELAGGRLRWTSHAGHETLFQVHMPIVAAPDQAAQSLPAGAAPKAGGPPAPAG
jgi:signal transduction histidine kinase